MALEQSVNRELGELSTKIDGLTTLIKVSHEAMTHEIGLNRSASTSHHDRIYDKFEEATRIASQLRTDHETLRVGHNVLKVETHRSIGRMWKVMLLLLTGSATIAGLAKTMSG